MTLNLKTKTYIFNQILTPVLHSTLVRMCWYVSVQHDCRLLLKKSPILCAYDFNFIFVLLTVWLISTLNSDLFITIQHQCSLLLTDLRTLLLLWMIVVCLVAWIHQLRTLNISNWCVCRVQAWRSYIHTAYLYPTLLHSQLLSVCVCVFHMNDCHSSDIFIFSNTSLCLCLPVLVYLFFSSISKWNIKVWLLCSDRKRTIDSTDENNLHRLTQIIFIR